MTFSGVSADAKVSAFRHNLGCEQLRTWRTVRDDDVVHGPDRVEVSEIAGVCFVASLVEPIEISHDVLLKRSANRGSGRWLDVEKQAVDDGRVSHIDSTHRAVEKINVDSICVVFRCQTCERRQSIACLEVRSIILASEKSN